MPASSMLMLSPATQATRYLCRWSAVAAPLPVRFQFQIPSALVVYVEAAHPVAQILMAASMTSPLLPAVLPLLRTLAPAFECL